MVSKKEVCESANSQHYKASDAKGLGADAKIIIALLKQQPLKRLELCEKANINESTFSRYKRLLLNQGILKESNQGFSLWFQIEIPKLWDTMYDQLQKVGGHLTEVKLERLTVERKPYVAYMPNETYKTPVLAKGVIILKGAVELERALVLGLPHEYKFYVRNRPLGGFFVTPVLMKRGDRFAWDNKIFEVDSTEHFFDGENLSYTLAMLKTPT